MCRWLAYSGSPVLLEELLYKPKHSLIDQSLHSTMGAETTNGDGFGIGWYGVGETPATYHSIEPAWNERNLRDLAAHVESRLVFAHIRASSGSPVQQTNCHPFRHGRWLWMHNGLIADFHEVKRDLVLAVDPSLYSSIEGSTDSEVFFHLALTLGLEDDPPGASDELSFVPMNHSFDTSRRYPSVSCHSRAGWYAWPSPPRLTGVAKRMGSQPCAVALGTIATELAIATSMAAARFVTTHRSMERS